jgi:hypothetical protein
MGRREVYTGFWRVKPRVKRPLGRPWCTLEDNIKMDIQEVGWGLDLIDLAQDRYRWRDLANAAVFLIS